MITYRIHPSRPNLKRNQQDGGNRPLWVVRTFVDGVQTQVRYCDGVGMLWASAVEGEPMEDGTRLWVLADEVVLFGER